MSEFKLRAERQECTSNVRTWGQHSRDREKKVLRLRGRDKFGNSRNIKKDNVAKV